MISNLQILHPQFFYMFIFIVPILLSYWYLFEYRQSHLDAFTSEEIIKHLLLPRSKSIFWGKVLAICVIWLFISMSLMQPIGNKRFYGEGFHDQKKNAHEVIFLIDASASMAVTDTPSKLSRLDLAKDITDQVVRNLQGESVGLYAFTGIPTMLVPLTTDYFFFRLMLKNMNINEGDIAGTNFRMMMKVLKKKSFRQTY